MTNKTGLKKTREHLKRLGVRSTCVILGRKDGKVCILDVPKYSTCYSLRPRPPKGLLNSTIWDSYDDALDVIIANPG